MAPAAALDLIKSCVFALAGAIVALALILLVQRGIAALAGLRTRKREAKLAPAVYRALEAPDDHGALLSVSGFDRPLVRGILLRLAMDLRGDTGEAITALYRRLEFIPHDLARLRSRNPSTRARATADLGLIRAADVLPVLMETLKDSNVRVRQTAAWAVGQMGGPEALTVLVGLLGDPSQAVALRAQEVLSERGNEVKDAILTYAGRTTSRAGRIAAIELLGWLRMAEGVEILLGFVTDLDPEVRIKSVKAAAALGDPRFLDVFHRRLADSRWEVRCQAAKGVSAFGSPSSVPHLTAALRDPHWWVRFYAAAALVETGPLGKEALSCALIDAEQSVRAMARYLLERGSAVPALP